MATCPSCSSKRIATKNKARKVGAGIGTVAGAGSAFGNVTAGAVTGASYAVKNFSAGFTPVTLFSAILGGLVGAVTGCVTGSTLGSALDNLMLDNYECLDCGYHFSNAY